MSQNAEWPVAIQERPEQTPLKRFKIVVQADPGTDDTVTIYRYFRSKSAAHRVFEHAQLIQEVEG